METGPWPHLDRRQERGVVWGGRHRFFLEVPANFGELRFGEVRVLGFLRSSLSAYRASTGPGYPSGCPGPSVANILRRGGRPAEVRHVPDNKGVGCRGVDNLAVDALPTVPPTVPL